MEEQARGAGFVPVKSGKENTLVIANTLSNNTREYSIHGHHQMVNTEVVRTSGAGVPSAGGRPGPGGMQPHPRPLLPCVAGPLGTPQGLAQWKRASSRGEAETLENITTNKANGGDGIPVELIQILKDDAVKVWHSIWQQIWKTQQWPQDWKRPDFIPSPKKGNGKECSNYCPGASRPAQL